MSNDYHCNKCNSIVGKWKGKWNNFCTWKYTLSSKYRSCDSIEYLLCKTCNNKVGLFFFNVCTNCFGENQIFGKENLENWYINFKKTVKEKSIVFDPKCLVCNKKKHRFQYWFYENSTIQKKNKYIIFK